MAPSHVHLNSFKARLGPQSEPGEEEKVGRGQVIGVVMDIYTVIVLFGDNGVRRVNVSGGRCVNVCVNISSHPCAVRRGRGNTLGMGCVLALTKPYHVEACANTWLSRCKTSAWRCRTFDSVPVLASIAKVVFFQ